MPRLEDLSQKLGDRASKTKEVEKELGLEAPKPVLQNQQLLKSIFQKLKGQPQEEQPAAGEVLPPTPVVGQF